MTTFDDNFAAAAVPELQGAFGQSVVYEEPDYDPVTLTALVSPAGTEEIEDAAGGMDRRRTRNITFCRDDDGTFAGLPEIALHGRIELDGEVWAIDELISQTAVTTEVRCLRVGRTARRETHS